MRKIFILALLLSLVGCDSSPDNLASTAVEAPLPNFSEYSDVNEKKEAFFSFLLPLVHEANARILSERRSEEHTSELQSRPHLVCRLLLEKKKKKKKTIHKHQNDTTIRTTRKNTIAPSLHILTVSPEQP